MLIRIMKLFFEKFKEGKTAALLGKRLRAAVLMAHNLLPTPVGRCATTGSVSRPVTLPSEIVERGENIRA